MSNKRPSENNTSDRPTQRRRTDFSAVPMLLLQVWPELVVEARAARENAEAENATLRSLLDEHIDRLNERDRQLADERDRVRRQVVFHTVLMGIIADAVVHLDDTMSRAIRDRVFAALQQLDPNAALDLTASDDEEL